MTNNQRKSIDLLPSFFRTDKNNKFLSSTLDQLISSPELTRIDEFAGSKNTLNYKSTDQYVSESNPIREAYQLEPALVVKTLTQEIKKAFALDDLLNQINNKGGNATNLNRSFEPKFHSYDPKIDWDKFINFREYFWLPSGPSTITISGDNRPSIVEYTVTDAEDKTQFLFNGLTPSQSLILYRGTTYIFNVDTTQNFYIKYTNDYGPDNSYEILENNGIKKGQIIFSVSFQTPENLYYVSENEQLSTGQIFVKDPAENTAINVEDEILGKKYYTSSTGITFINGLKIKFAGLIFPETYRDLEFIVDGVGDRIKLVQFNELDTPDFIAETFNTRFDGTNFDQFPFDNFKNIPLVPEYVTINKSSRDKNPWSRYNRWFHIDVINTTAAATGATPIYPVEYRALRPIIEFNADMQLYNFGSIGIKNIDLIDNTITDIFNAVEGTAGYYIDGVLLEEGFRIIFNADNNPQIRNKIYRAHFVIIGDNTTLDLVEDDDLIQTGVSVLVKQGKLNTGTAWHFNSNNWIKSQQKSERNQAPLFELYDNKGVSFSERNANTNFSGNKIFGYGVGTGTPDPLLGFPLLYKNVGVEGAYLFKNFFATDEFLIVENNLARLIPTASTFFKINNQLCNVWTLSDSYSIPVIDNVYEAPVNLTNNPLNDPIAELTLTEISDHVKSMTENDPNFVGTFPGNSNIKDLPNISKYGSRLISNINPISFSKLFIADEANSLVNATRLVGENYQQFKLNLIKTISTSNQTLSPVQALDAALLELNQNKTTAFPYYYSDMIPFGTGAIVANTIIIDTKTKIFKIPGEFTDQSLSTKGVLVYLNGNQLVKEIDYLIADNNVEITTLLELQDSLEIKFYPTTTGSFIPPTPTKLGLYPKYEPKIYLDDTFAGEPMMVLQGHDGSITVTFDDYRDQILLEYEQRVFNNLKAQYKQDLFDINLILPSAYRNQEYNYREIFNSVHKDFLRWKSTFSVEADENLTFDINNHRTYNFSNVLSESKLPGHWRAIYKMFFDTDRPHTHPWEMLGFSMKPIWWDDEYGSAPYTADNLIMWSDISEGRILHGDRQGIDINYIRPDLLTILPVTSSGSLVDVRDWGIIGNSGYIDNVDNNWKFGDMGPAENSWRRSSYWPFAVQIILALAKPATYSALLFDTSRMVKNIIGQYVYSEDNLFLNHTKVLLPYDVVDGNIILTSGYSVYVVEAGQIRSSGYVQELKEDMQNSSFNLMHKVGGFVSKDKLEVVIDSVNPNSISPGVLLPTEDYTIHFNVSNPIKIVNISGFIIQKHNGGYIVRGYDRAQPFFTIFKGLHEKGDTFITVGGTSEDFAVWSPNTYYPIGKVVSYDNIFYRSNNNHDSGLAFNPLNYVKIPALPIVNGITIAYPSFFENDPIEISYGSFFDTIQEVADIIAGYGKWLEFSGFIFDELNADLDEILDWRLTIKEFIYWSGQNWAENSVIALSPFANSLKFTFQDSVVDNVLDSFYDYNILKADGYGISPSNLSILRDRGACTITSKNDQEGIFFASLRLIQKEHTIILNNTSRFNDVIYDIDTGYRQRRIRLIGFRTANWNGDYFSPGFIYDAAKVYTWLPNKDYQAGDVVEYAGNYYSLDRNLSGKPTFDFTNWNKLGKKPVAQLIPNFEYKINQFEDFYSLDIDNFDLSQQQLAQQLTGYSPRVYLSNIFFNQLAQYKFFQGFIKEKGTRNALDKLVRASVHNLQGKLDFKEEWAFRIGTFGAYSSLDEIEFPLQEFKMIDNSQLINFVNEDPVIEYDATNYITPSDLTITPVDYSVDTTFDTVKEANNLNPFALPVAGYIRLDDVDYTVKTKEDLFNFEPGKTVRLGETIWVGFDDNNDWNAYRYARLNSAVTAAFDVVAGKQIGFLTDKYHGLAVGDIIAVTRFNSEVNGIYRISEVPKLDQFVVETDKFAPPDTNMFGVLFKFLPARFNKFDDLAEQPFIADFKIGKKIWIDENADGFWEVYEKIDNYNPYRLTYPYGFDQTKFGFKIVSKEESDIVLTSAPSDPQDERNDGRIYVYTHRNGVIRKLGEYAVNVTTNVQYYDSVSNSAEIGRSLDFDGIDQVIAIGAPFANDVRAPVGPEFLTTYISDTVPGRSVPNEGLVIISTASEEKGIQHHVRLACQEPEAGLNFGYGIFLGTTASTKTLLVGAPGKDANAGAVYSYNVAYSVSFDGATTEVAATATTQIKLPTDGIEAGYRFGEIIAGDKTGARVAITAPGYDNSKGAVYVYENTNTSIVNYVKVQELKWNDAALDGKIPDDGQFGYDIDMDDSGNWLFISAYNAKDRVLETGKVAIYKWTGEEFEFTQMLDNPSSAPGMKFGHSIESDSSGNILTISSLGSNYFDALTFDEATTTFDSESTKLGTLIRNSGSAYVYNRYGDKFIFADELFNSDIKEDSNYGYAVSVNRNSIYVSAPTYRLNNENIQRGNIHVWDTIDPAINSWQLLRSQEALVDISKFKQVKTIDTFNQSVIDYLEIIDPVKGRIPQLADQEIRYKTPFDPAIYNTGTNQTTNIEPISAWFDNNVGELWWDLSSVKYVWYEQGEDDYKKNAWGSLFPGCTIDVYEWVKSEYLPDRWAIEADTTAGLAEGISGQPKYIDNSAYSTRQIYSSVSDLFTNVYYFWVKNTVIIPNRQGRTMSAYDVALLISDPKLYGLKYIQPLSNKSLSVVNIKEDLINDRVLLNIQIDDIDNQRNKHTEWLLLEEDSYRSLPNFMLEKKMIDSLLGRDSLGNLVPDPNLSDRLKYGIEIRPRQSMFKNRIAALRNFIEFTNNVFRENLIIDYFSLKTLNSKEEIPDITTAEYDIVVDDLDQLRELTTTFIKTAQLSCEITAGKISNVIILDSGFGYGKLEPKQYNAVGDVVTWRGPTVEILGEFNNGLIETEVNNSGEIIVANVVDGGTGYITAPELTVRSYSVLVLSDAESRGLWSKYTLIENELVKIQTQSYNTSLYWDVVDWVSPDYNQFRKITATYELPYEIAELELSPGDYIKINNNGRGRFLILKKLAPGEVGKFNENFDIVYSEKGTIKIKDIIWKIDQSQFGWDQTAPYDNTFWDQTPDIEISKIIDALKNDIFVGNLTIYWNKAFFACVKYALTEQKFVDWAFKTSFISVENKAGTLSQRPVYKFQDTQWYESYLKEIKPYHTNIRNYILNYTVDEPTRTFTTDFDLPAVYNSTTDSYDPLTENNPLVLQYPYRGWYDNRKLFVEKIVIDFSGLQYIEQPIVQIIAAPNDVIVRPATAVAYISAGSVYAVEVTDPGEGYSLTPTVILTGGVSESGTPARLTAHMSNKKVRSNLVGIKFDRISSSKEIGNMTVTDTFVSSGAITEFELSWPANPDKNNISLTIRGITVPFSNYDLEDFVKDVEYKKTYTKLILRNPPDADSIIQITYRKSFDIYSAYDRIEDYFLTVPEDSPGKNNQENHSQLMTGMEYPGTTILTEPLRSNYTWDAIPFDSVSWNKLNFGIDDLDALIDGGNLTTSTTGQFATAAGIDPSDIILDGDAFISPFRSYGPEELIPGEVKETLGISVFARESSGSPMIYTQFSKAIAGIETIIPLKITPPSVGSVRLTYNQTVLKGVIGNEYLISDNVYRIDFDEKTIYVKPQTTDGDIAVTYLDVGGTNFISMNHSYSEGSTTASVLGDCQIDQVGSVYVTLDGNRVTATESTNTFYYQLTESVPGIDRRAKVTIYGLGLSEKKTITAAFFGASYKGFSEVYEQLINNMSAGFRAINLIQPPGSLGPITANSIVEVNGQRIIPPNTTYYEITSVNQLSFDISTKEIYPPNTFDKTRIEVYKNGILIIPVDYHLDDNNNRIMFPTGFFEVGDLLAITAFVDYDYFIRGNILEITERIPLTLPNYVRILTFTNHDASLIRTEVFNSTSNKLYKISRKIVNDNFVWVTIGNKTLTSGIDFKILDDGFTVQLASSIAYIEGEDVIITSFGNREAGRTVGYRIFKDPLNRQHFKRLAKPFTTYLTQPLMLTDTEIYVADATVLPDPDIRFNVPGIILIAGERVEYLEKRNNILSKIKRATLGTGAKEYLAQGTWVIDQGKKQTVPFKETIAVQTINTSTSSITINTSTIKFNSLAAMHDQIEVYYGGKPLEKPTADNVFRYVHDASSYYDPVNMTVRNPEFIVTGTTVTATLVLSFMPDTDVSISIVQRQSTNWYGSSSSTLFESAVFDNITPPVMFIKQTEAVSVDQLYYGGDPTLRFDDGTALLLDDGRVIKGY
jgi:hypothetical protein